MKQSQGLIKGQIRHRRIAICDAHNSEILCSGQDCCQVPDERYLECGQATAEGAVISKTVSLENDIGREKDQLTFASLDI